ncbi:MULTISPECIES: hypothetical protein [unclassified Streptomyces]|uniref:hypothetical protein n=1 Tax=unclassified Streptomyces TaxID=2593676 RepID=UPI00226EF0E7|nr:MULTISPECIES: hypothetical protein [unclassified Streptomyces]MCY0922568.1 hypothetical protein [Streptomyces sp. H27-G5]MCY0962646.1 hypothetical protein [Streptomyces sp. H27-H5]
MRIHTLMELLPENGFIAVLTAVGALIIGPPLLKALRREVGAYWSPKITHARTWIARSVAPKTPAQSADTAREEIIQVRERV